MFRRRLTLSLCFLAGVAIVQGIGAVLAIGIARDQVERGRVASDIRTGFVELSASKQRLRTWVAQRQQGAGADPMVREALQQDMRDILARLDGLSVRAAQQGGGAETQADQARRRDAVSVLVRSVAELEQAVDAAEPLAPGADALQAWQALSAVFDRSQGRDLRQLIDDSLGREAAAVERERQAADRTLAWMRQLWLAMAATLAILAAAAAVHFARALRRPLDHLSEGAQALQRGDLTHRIPLAGVDEFSAVAVSMNAMAAELEQHRAREAQARHRLEEEVALRTAELQQALDALQGADARRRRLFADISHELRTPTTAIRGEAEVTLRGADRPADEYKAALRRIVDTSTQLGHVINDLLAMARTDMESLALAREPLALEPLVSDVVAQASAMADAQGVVLYIGPPSAAAESPRVSGDAQRLRQILLILLDNAVRYSHAGGRVAVSVSAIPEVRECRVRVRDEGIGIDPDELAQVFDRHFRGRAARRQRPEGSGLGLPIAQALAQSHGGRIEVVSGQQGAAGRTTVATLCLPMLPPAADHLSRSPNGRAAA